LISESGHLKIADFGTALLMTSKDTDLCFDFVGTAHYVSPGISKILFCYFIIQKKSKYYGFIEVLKGEEAPSRGSDLWALGCIVFYMLCGKTPFAGDTEFLTFQNILNFCNGISSIDFPIGIEASSSCLILELLKPVASERLGADSENDGMLLFIRN